MIDLIIIACLSTAPHQCRPYIIPSEGTVQQCAATAMLSVARWASDHPGWDIKRVECRAFEREA